LVQVNGALYGTTEHDTFSINPDTCRENWRAHEEFPSRPFKSNRGVAFLDGKAVESNGPDNAAPPSLSNRTPRALQVGAMPALCIINGQSLITQGMQQTGERIPGKPHATFEAAGAGKETMAAGLFAPMRTALSTARRL
jgi:hypothetical protein